MRFGNVATSVSGCVLVALLGLWLVAVPAAGQEAEEPAAPSEQPAGEVAAAPSAQAEAETPELPAQKRESEFIDLFKKGGQFMWPLLLLAIVALAVILERVLMFQRQQTNTRRLMAAVISDLKGSGVEKAKEACMNTRGPIAAILHAGLTKVERGPAAVEKAIENSGAIEMAFLQRGMPVLSTVANIAPLLGFLGTVSGMINAFEAIAAAEQVSAKVVASGISEALITTMSGLVIAIPAQIAFNYFVSRVDRFVIEMEESSVELLDTLTEMS